MNQRDYKRKKTFIDIIFILVFFLSLFLPLINLSKKIVSEQENRALAKLPSLTIRKKLNQKFGQEFEHYISDHFGGREDLISSYFQLLRKINYKVETKRALMTSSGWIFDKNFISKLRSPISDKVIKKIRKNLNTLVQWSERNKIKTIILIVPEKENLNLPNTHYVPPIPDKVDVFLSKISDIPIQILYPNSLYEREDLNDNTFFRTDHHWTEYGAFLAYQLLIRKLRIDFPKIHLCSEEEFNVFYDYRPRLGSFSGLFERPFYQGKNCSQIGFNKKNCPLKYPYRYYDHKNKNELIVEKGSIPSSRITHFKNAQNDLKITIIGYSDAGFLMSFIPFSVKDVQMFRVNNGEKGKGLNLDRFKKQILDFHPDILLIMVRTSQIEDLERLY